MGSSPSRERCAGGIIAGFAKVISEQGAWAQGNSSRRSESTNRFGRRPANISFYCFMTWRPSLSPSPNPAG